MSVLRKVLVVDDSATDLKNLEQICTGGGYDVITATSGVEAVAKASRENPGCPVSRTSRSLLRKLL